jgi:flavin reductase (DIM6/NTAB) family NADH-FMN oxidoreductase RutF
MKEEWIKALGTMTNGIYLLTASHAKAVNGMIASWVSQVSYEPPLIAVAVHPNRFSHKLIEQSRSFVLHVMKKTQKNLVMQFIGSQASQKFAGIEWQPGKTGCPILKDCRAWFECRLQDQIKPGNHSLFIGEVVAAETVAADAVLTTQDYRGQYIGKV